MYTYVFATTTLVSWSSIRLMKTTYAQVCALAQVFCYVYCTCKRKLFHYVIQVWHIETMPMALHREQTIGFRQSLTTEQFQMLFRWSDSISSVFSVRNTQSYTSRNNNLLLLFLACKISPSNIVLCCKIVCTHRSPTTVGVQLWRNFPLFQFLQ